MNNYSSDYFNQIIIIYRFISLSFISYGGNMFSIGQAMRQAHNRRCNIMTLVERDQLVVKIKLCANLATWMQNKGDHNKHNELIRKAANLFFSIPANMR